MAEPGVEVEADERALNWTPTSMEAEVAVSEDSVWKTFLLIAWERLMALRWHEGLLPSAAAAVVWPQCFDSPVRRVQELVESHFVGVVAHLLLWPSVPVEQAEALQAQNVCPSRPLPGSMMKCPALPAPSSGVWEKEASSAFLQTRWTLLPHPYVPSQLYQRA